MMLGKLLSRGAVATQRQVALASRRHHRRGVAASASWGGVPSSTALRAAAPAASDSSAVRAASAGLRRQLGTAAVGTVGDSSRVGDELPLSDDDAIGDRQHETEEHQGQQGHRQQWEQSDVAAAGGGGTKEEERGGRGAATWGDHGDARKPRNSRGLGSSSRGGGGRGRGRGGWMGRGGERQWPRQGRGGFARRGGGYDDREQNDNKVLGPSGQYAQAMMELKHTGSWIEIIEMYKRATALDDDNVNANESANAHEIEIENDGAGEKDDKKGKYLRSSRIVYNSTIAALAQSPRWQVSLSVFQEMRDVAKVAPDTYTFNAALMACKHGRQGKLAFALFREMREAGVVPDRFTYTHLIVICGQEGKYEEALALLEEMKAASLWPNCVTYNAVIIAYGNAGEPQRAVDLLETMREEGLQVSEGSYSAAMAACGKAGEWERALELMEEMKEGRDNLEPNEYCYNSAICACERSARWKEAVDLLRDMQAAELTVTTGTYTHVVKACTNAGEISQARALLNEMRSNGMPVKKGTVAMVEKQFEKRRTQRSWRESSPVASGSPATARGDGGMGGVAATSSSSSSWTDPLGQEQSPPPPSLSSSSRVPRARPVKHFLRTTGSHARHKRWAEILADLDRAMADPNTKVSMRMYEACLMALASGGKWVEALSVLERMQGVGLKPDSRRVTGAIKACANGKPPQWGLALSLLRGLEHPEVWAYVAALTALARAGQLKASVKLLEEMRAEEGDVKPNVYCYQGVLEACRLADPPQWQQACSTLTQMKTDGMQPNAACYRTAILACRGASEDAQAQSLMSEMVEAGFSPQEELPEVPVVGDTDISAEGAPSVVADVVVEGGVRPIVVASESASSSRAAAAGSSSP